MNSVEIDANAVEEAVILSNADVNDLLDGSRNPVGVERRAAERYPFFAPVCITSCDASQQRRSAFSRDMSTDGIGLLHNMPIDRGTICDLSITQNGINFRRRSQAMWCSAVGEGWYLSGWRFEQANV
jgi:hypothetical protein